MTKLASTLCASSQLRVQHRPPLSRHPLDQFHRVFLAGQGVHLGLQPPDVVAIKRVVEHFIYCRANAGRAQLLALHHLAQLQLCATWALKNWSAISGTTTIGRPTSSAASRLLLPPCMTIRSHMGSSKLWGCSARYARWRAAGRNPPGLCSGPG